jgi:3-(3-hydroxy-phenyl)propionate hydroxylase
MYALFFLRCLHYYLLVNQLRLSEFCMATNTNTHQRPNSYEKAAALNPFAGSGYKLPTYPFAPPPELTDPATQTQLHPVVIVGAGLSGLTAACDFALRGIAAIVIDEDDTVGVKGASSRGICYAQKSLEIFQRLGLFERIKRKGIEWSVGKTLAGNDIVYEFDLATQATHNGSQQPPFINLQQFYLEWFLVDRIHELNVSKIRWQSRVKSVRQEQDHVVLAIETPQGDYELKTQWLIDASGLRSPIRAASGLKVEEAKGEDRWCISDVRFKDKKPIERWTWIEAPFNDNRAVWQHLMADDVWRLDYQMEPEADPAHVSSPEVVADRLKRHLGEDVEFDLIWVGPYAYKSHLLESFRHQRIFFAGDCAHVMSPFGARGGNSAIQDADNLVWKLALVLDKRANESILDSYSDERREGAKTNIQITNRTARYLSPRTPVERMIRNATIALAKKFPFARAHVNTGRLSTANTYTEKPFSIGAVPSQPVQNCNTDQGDLASVIAKAGHLPLLVATCAGGIDLLGKQGWSAEDISAQFSVQPTVFTVIGSPSPPCGWLHLQVSEQTLMRLHAVMNLSDKHYCAVLRPDLYTGGISDTLSLRNSLVSLGLQKAVSA